MRKVITNFTPWIPSVLTLTNLALGFVAIGLNHPFYSMLLIFIACFFDIFDGIVARALKVEGEFGKQLDSLADLVTFGVAPAYLVYKYCLTQNYFNLIFIALIPVFSAIRLARFNIDINQKKSFIGLPTPANGLFFASLPFMFSHNSIKIREELILILILLFSYLLVCRLSMFSFKNLKQGGINTYLPVSFIVIISGLFFAFNWFAIPLSVFSYILLSVFYTLYLKFEKQ